VITESTYRGRGLSAACSAALCVPIRRRGHQPTWTTAIDNVASQRVAEKLGFEVHHYDRLLVVGGTAPEPPLAPG
jgi:predicted GNAT family acetyltransferase